MLKRKSIIMKTIQKLDLEKFKSKSKNKILYNLQEESMLILLCDHYYISSIFLSISNPLFICTCELFFSYFFFYLAYEIQIRKLKKMKSNQFQGSIGSQIMIAQQQSRHQKRLDQIYNQRGVLSSKTINYEYLIRSSLRNTNKISKKSFNEEMNHHLTLKHLIKRLNSPKSYYDRLKDENDFIAYPSLFFRNQQKEMKQKKYLKQKKSTIISSYGNKTNKNVASMSNMNRQQKQVIQNTKKKQLKSQDRVQQNNFSASVNSELQHNGLTLEKVTNELPKLQKFEKNDIETFTDHLTRLIFKYNLNTMEDIEFLFQCVENYLPQNYPEHFVNAIQDMFKQIVSSLNIEEE